MKSSNRILPREFLKLLADLEDSYLKETDPQRQSGSGGGAKRWRGKRGVILQAIDSDGDFLDIGCANGYLLECLCMWAREKNVILNPFGVDLGKRLIQLARSRFPNQKNHFWTTNAWDWAPPKKFRYVYSLCDCVPYDFLEEYIWRLKQRYVEKDGTLILGSYGSSKNIPALDVAKILTDWGFTVLGSVESDEPPVSRMGWIKG